MHILILDILETARVIPHGCNDYLTSSLLMSLDAWFRCNARFLLLRVACCSSRILPASTAAHDQSCAQGFAWLGQKIIIRQELVVAWLTQAGFFQFDATRRESRVKVCLKYLLQVPLHVICICAWHACAHVLVCKCVHAHWHASVYMHDCVHLHAYAYANAEVYLWYVYLWAYVHVYTHMFFFVHVYVYVDMHAYMCLCVCV